MFGTSLKFSLNCSRQAASCRKSIYEPNHTQLLQCDNTLTVANYDGLANKIERSHVAHEPILRTAQSA